jgi:transposase InsO family protein
MLQACRTAHDVTNVARVPSVQSCAPPAWRVRMLLGRLLLGYRGWNSDKGSHFSSAQYRELLPATGVQIRMDGKGRALDNIFVERLWRSVKYEEVYPNDYANPREARERLAHYLAFYNHEPPHRALNYQTPAEVYTGAGASAQQTANPTAEHPRVSN